MRLLTRKQILKAIKDGRLTVEPLLEKFQIREYSIDIRVGTQFHRSESSGAFIETAQFGKAILLSPFTSICFVTFETLRLAPDLMGIARALDFKSDRLLLHFKMKHSYMKKGPI